MFQLKKNMLIKTFPLTNLDEDNLEHQKKHSYMYLSETELPLQN